ncbi:hypothetical protein CLOP_g8884 [Closterium sp. NIES-67]|nr:hypothetical protein CLOP_g8884 [Closterium sp. NIES-67]
MKSFATLIKVVSVCCLLSTGTRGEGSVGSRERPSFHVKFPRKPKSEARAAEANESIANQTLTLGVLTADDLAQGLSIRSAIQLAYEEVLADPSLSFPYPLKLAFGNAASTRFQAQATALEVLLDNALLLVGPQFSSQAHSIIDLCRDYQVPMLSYSATDPTFSSKGQFPFFVRLSHSDQMEMEVVADLLEYYDWHQAIMIFSDDEFGHNGMDSLTNILMAKSQQLPLQFSNKVALDPRASQEGIKQLLRAMQSSETSVFVVHVASTNVLFLFEEAQRMGLMSEGYVWISTEGSISHLMGADVNSTYLSTLTGMMGTRVAIRDNPRLQEFRRSWKALDPKKYPGAATDTVSPYALLGYDAMWVAARALHNLSHIPGARFPFRPPRSPLPSDAGGSTDFARLNVSRGGITLLEALAKTQMEGIIGNIAFDKNHDRVGVSYEVVNLLASKFETLGYWEQGKGLVALESHDSSNSTLKPAVWPGNTSKFPRGWLPSKGKALRIAVPFGPATVAQYVNRTPDGNFTGFCVEVFQRAMALLPYPVGYSLVPYDFQSNSYEDLVRSVADKEFDGAIGDITVTADRAQTVDFTQPFMESGLGLVVPVLQGDPTNPWAFLYPFTASMWALMIASIFFTAAVIWYLEHNQNLDFGGGPTTTSSPPASGSHLPAWSARKSSTWAQCWVASWLSPGSLWFSSSPAATLPILPPSSLLTTSLLLYSHWRL